MKKYTGILIILICILLDQVTKLVVFNNNINITIIPGLLNFTLVKNYGAAFGMMQGANIVIAITTAIILLGLGVVILLCYRKDKAISLAYYFVLGGGIANLIDRIFRGFVIDFIDTPFIATFNLADSFIVCSAIWIVLLEVKNCFKPKDSVTK
jgi:signal peptidase II